jgi:(+)-trans-carveol dehydrogenase
MGKLDGKVAFITGVARGQGRAHAVRLAEEGADVIGIDLLEPEPYAPYPMGTQDDMDETVVLVEKTGRGMIGVKADVRDRVAIRSAVDRGIDEFGRLDIVVASAGVSSAGAPLWELPPEQWDAVIATNLTGVFHTVAAAVPAMIAAGNGGCIICTSSGAGLRYVPNLADYNAAKAGVVAIGKTLANELASQGIRVNVLAPGTVNTPLITDNKEMFKLFRPDLTEPTIEDALPVFTAMMPMGQPWVEPIDVANAVVFLASDEARYITGQVLAVDQGATNRP